MSKFLLVQIKDFAHYYVVKPHRKGRGIKDPFVLDFIGNVLYHKENALLREMEYNRKKYLCNNTILEIEDFGAGSRNNKSRCRKISEIAGNASSSSRKCRLLFYLVAHYRPATIIELGTSLGIGTLCLSMANRESTVYTIEGSMELYRFASSYFKKQGAGNIQPICGRFDEVLPDLLPVLGGADMFFIDGNHTYEATLRYFDMACKYSNNGAILVFDDIRWSEGMYRAWLEICCNLETKITIDLLDIGIVFINNKIRKQNLRIYY
jgi:predicted O-methyltransferase YrrM